MTNLKESKVKLGTVIERTLRPEDIIPALASELQYLDRNKFRNFVKSWNNNVPDFSDQNDVNMWVEESYEDADWMIEDLIDALDSLAPEGVYFGTHPDDGADFGFWSEDILD